MHPTRAGFPVESVFLVEADPPGVVRVDVLFEHRRELLHKLGVFDDDAVFSVVKNPARREVESADVGALAIDHYGLAVQYQGL